MRIIVYGKPHNNRVLAAFVEGCQTLGHVVVQRNHSVFTPDQTEPADMVAVYGWKGTCPTIAAAYKAKCVPCIVIDYAYICRDKDYHSVGIDGLNAIPSVSCPDDRLAAFGTYPKAKPGKDVLVIGQCPGDAQLPTNHDVRQWANNTIEAAKEQYPDCKIIWRPHPGAGELEVKGADSISTGPLGEALDGCQAIITYNSTTAYESMLRGVKVICDGSAVYAPHVDNPLPFLCRMAYGQWTTAELADGSALRFITEGPQNETAEFSTEAPTDDAGHAESPRRNDEGQEPRTRKKVGRRAK